MTAVAMIRLVMAREIRQRLRSKGFFIFTALLCAGIIGIGVLNRVLAGDDSAPRYDYTVLGESPDSFATGLTSVAGSLGIELTFHPPTSRSQAEQDLREGRLDIVVDASTGELLSKHEPADRVAASFNAAWQAATARSAAESAGIDDAVIDEILSPPTLESALLEPDTDSDDDVGQVVGTVTAVLLFISINAFGGMVLTGVVEEKTTGVVEVLLSHVRAHRLLTGKVLGIGVVAMMQFSAALAAGVVSLRISDTSVPGEVWVGLPTTVLWFVVGFVFYSTLYTLAGSFVSRQEDAQGAAAPISMVFTAAYLAVFALGSEPHSTAARIASLLPPFAPLLMPLRIATGAASIVEIAAAGLLLIVATFAMLRLAGAVYGKSLLHRGSRLTWRQALRMASSRAATSGRGQS